MQLLGIARDIFCTSGARPNWALGASFRVEHMTLLRVGAGNIGNFSTREGFDAEEALNPLVQHIVTDFTSVESFAFCNAATFSKESTQNMAMQLKGALEDKKTGSSQH